MEERSDHPSGWKQCEMKLKGEGCLGRCRCCYAEVDANCRRLQHSSSVFGPRETYLHMLNNTFSMTLPQVKCDHICEGCVERLQDASSFKKLVLDTEQRFLQLLPGCSKGRGDPAASLVKIEVFPEHVPEEKVQWDDDFLNFDEFPQLTSSKIKKLTSKAPHSTVKSTGSTIGNPLRFLPDNTHKRSVFTQFVKLLASKNVASTLTERLSIKCRKLKEIVNRTARTKPAQIKAAPIRTAPVETPKRVSRSSVTAADFSSDASYEPLPPTVTKRKLRKSVMPSRIAPAATAKLVKKVQRRPEAASSGPKTRSSIMKSKMTSTPPFPILTNEKKMQRQTAKRNVALLLKHTTVCPFTHHWSVLSCFYCRKAFPDFQTLRLHTDTVHEDLRKALSIPCKNDTVVYVDITVLKCRQCDADYPDIDSIKPHLINEHKVNIKSPHKDDIIPFKMHSGKYECHICYKDFHVFRNLSQHMNEHFINYICQVCGKASTSERRHASHESTHSIGKYPCSKCDKVFPSLNARGMHSIEHRGPKYRCPHCKARFMKYLERTVHISEVHNITHTFRCTHPNCDKEFIHKPLLQAHTRTHMVWEKKIVCSECGMRFSNNYSLYRHAVTHRGERPFQCKICGKKCLRKYKLAEHMKEHNGS